MSTTRNLIPNPSAEINTAGFSGSNSTVTRSTARAFSGVACFQLTAEVPDTKMALAMLSTNRLPVVAGVTYTVSASAASLVTDRVISIDYAWEREDGSRVSAYTVATTGISGGAWRRLQTGPLTAPAGATRLLLSFAVTGAQLGEVHLWDAVMVEASQVAGPYADGDSAGWTWQGTPHASTSIGPAGVYEPEAELQRAGTVVDWIDLVPGFDESADAQTVVQVTADPARDPYITVREGRDARGTLTMHFVRETGYGLPGDRALRVQESLLTGAPHTLAFTDFLSGLGAPLELVPCGPVRRSRQALADEAWTVECDFHRTVTPA